ncbi:hypothetical protein CK203_056599 [Vitis vinifera]|uniref:Retrotransposon gag domain-containing protein n=1 Tax=Vitis vinifera TaxID=29760 RepID=A0A438GW28_VITVI|nr:hypothetical protein CK203_056599 [Vitis vinifera]
MKDKSPDAITNMEARLAKVELAMADTREGVDLIEQGMEKGLEDLREQIQDLREGVLGSVEVPKPHRFNGKRDAKKLDNFLWHMERYFEAIALTDEATKVRTTTLYLTDTATLWWHRRFSHVEKYICTIETWKDFKREIKRQFYPEDVAYLARKTMRHLKHTGSIRDYVKEFSSLMLEIPNMTEEELLFNFMDNLGDSSKVESLEDNHARSGRDEVSRDHNAPRMGSGNTPNVREGRGICIHPRPHEKRRLKISWAERVTRRQRVPLVLEYLVRWKGLPRRQVSWEHADALRRLWNTSRELSKLLETPGAIYTKPLEE